MDMKNMEIYEKFRKVPKEATKPIEAGRLKGMTDINPMWRIKMLTEQFGPCGIGWYTEVLDKEVCDGAEGLRVATIDINLYVKAEDGWSKPIFGTGGSSLVAKEKAGPYTSDEAFKMAYTDALSVACKALGMAADIYFAKDRTKYTTTEQDTQEPVQEEPYKPKASKQSIDDMIKAGAELGYTEDQIAEVAQIRYHSKLYDLTFLEVEAILKSMKLSAKNRK